MHLKTSVRKEPRWMTPATISSCRLLLLLSVLLMRGCREGAGEDVFASSAHLLMLEDAERELIDAARSYVEREKTRIERIQRLIEGIEKARAKDGESVPLVIHPVDAFHLVHRFTTTWKGDVFSSIFDTSASEDFRVHLRSLEPVIPTAVDYDGTRAAIIRLQHTYRLPVEDLINGTILGYRSKPMTQTMALDVSLYALYRSLSDDALVWAEHALNHLVPPLASLQEIYYLTARIYSQKGELLKAVDFVKKSLELDPSNNRYLSKLVPEDYAILPKWPNRNDQQERLCEEYVLEKTRNVTGKAELSCVYQRGKVVPFIRAKVEFIHRSPDVLLFHDFITDIESDQLQSLAKSKIQRAMIGIFDNRTVTEERIGKIAWFFDDTGEIMIDKISRRIGDVTRLETKYPASEALQLSNYGLGGYYSAHWDCEAIENPFSINWSSEMQMYGDRIATLMIYLNSVEAGGATVFPQLEIGIRPVKNAAVFWYNYKQSGVPDPRSLHSGCPVLIGEKWVANKWIREFGQVFRRPCELTIDV